MSAPLSRIALLATGGTIAGAAEDPTRQLGYRAGAIGVQAMLATVPGLNSLATIESEQLFAIDSAYIEYGHWRQLARRVQTLLARPDIDGAVILHGTDTLEETAFFLHLTIDSDKPVVLTGAMRPATALGADGPMNIYHAVSAAAHPACRGLGTLIEFGDVLLAARGLQKRDSVPGAFSADQYGRLGLVKDRDVFVYQRPTRARGGFAVPEQLPKVNVLTAFVDLPPALIEAACQDADGLVFAGVGNGNLRQDWLQALAAAAARGVRIVRASRVSNGTTVRNGEVDDDAYGFISADNLTPLQARILLALGLTRDRSTAALQELFNRY
ncbi:asparaginase [Tahibacter harae]|uniref:Asparaginase n=1 Tax=Tahibacter harae TaxID=2963937 RepID=A0ABT1QZ57_9GAMM|nr:asparaginase [Tahibacter harae]MCQ4167576.1 asparaginase [Tahibacter harae]